MRLKTVLTSLLALVLVTATAAQAATAAPQTQGSVKGGGGSFGGRGQRQLVKPTFLAGGESIQGSPPAVMPLS
ncbi:hypothetical protein [Deinococcus multiflagellatus]|uniref:Uncharacterized protein n=1 Tax=Deinococcus multiflagellatus TaxID=1656887 RepID=A0ABW1ZP06_9DEIO